MNKKFTKLMAALALLVMMTLPRMSVGQNVVSGTAYETKAPTSLPTGWSGEQTKSNNANYFSLTYSSDYIQTASFVQSGFTSITLKARKYGGPDASQGVITVSWYDSDSKTETVLGTISPSGTSLANNTISSPAEVDAGTGYVKIQCKNASSNKGCGVSEVTLYFKTNNPTITVNSTLAVTPVAVSNGELAVTCANITPANATITLFDSEDNDITSTCDWFTPAFNADFSKVIYSASENTSGISRSLRMHLHVANGSAVADADVAVSQDFILTTMDQILARATANGSTEKDVIIRLNNWVVNEHNGSHTSSTGYQNASKVWMTDATGTKGCVVYGSSPYAKFNIDDVLNGTVTCKLKLFTGYSQISSTSLNNQTSDLTVTNTPGTVTTHQATIDALNAVNTGSLVTISGLTYNGSTLSDGTNSITPYNQLFSSMSFTSGATYNVTGIFEYYKSGNTITKKIYPRSAADITEVTIPAITVAPQSLSNFTYCEGDGPSAAQTITVSGDNLEGNIALALNNGENSAFEISLSENSGYANTLDLTQANGTVGETTVYVRMKAGLEIDDYEDEINLTSTNATDVTVSLAGTVTGPQVTWDLSTASYSSASADLVTWSSNYVTMTNAKGTSTTGANNYLGGGNNNHTRLYKNQVLTFTPASGYALSRIEITAVSGNVAGFTGNTWTNATASTSGTLVTVTPSNGNNACSVVISVACYATSVTVYYEASTLTPHNITNDEDMVNGTVVATPATAVAGATVTLKVFPDAGYYLATNSDIIVVDEDFGDVELTNVNAGTFTFVMPDKDVTVYAAFTAYTGTYYTLVDDAADLIPGRHYIIANSKEAGEAYVMAAQGSGYREAVSATVVGNTIYQTTNVHEIVLSGDNTNFWTLYDDGTAVSSQGYLYAGTGNKLNKRTDNSEDNHGKWAISINNEGVAIIVSQIEGTDVSNTIKFNNSASPKRFSCYTPTSGQQSVYLYIKGGETDYELYSNTTCSSLTIGELDIYTVHSPAVLNVTGTLTNSGNYENLIIKDGGQLVTSNAVAATVQKTIEAHGATVEDGGWNFIATPIVEGTTPSTTNGILSSTGTDYDLFFYDEPTHYWRNYKNNNGNTSPEFDLRNGQGYLYANAVNTTLSFTGTLRPSNAEYTVNSLSYTSGIELAGFNLVGNPFACNATVDRACYIIQDGVIVATNGTVAAPCSGVMVQATTTGQSVTFTPTTNAAVFSTGHNQLNVTIANNMTARGEGSMIDNAIVSFNENSQLEKFVFFEDNAKLYIPQGEKDYAIVSAEAQGEMPVCFKAIKDGEYTITVSPEGVELNYLHLIDNMTGNDVDLLQTPSYTFEASTRDYESRFKLVFAGASTDSATDESFAYYDGSEWKVSNEGEATLQVVDVIGRIVKSESINGNFSLNLNQKAGVYMLRLINGENVKVQKVVVR